MKWHLICITVFIAFIQPIQASIQEHVKLFPASGFVNDFANLLKAEEKQDLESMIQSISDSTSIQFGVCLVDSLSGHDPKEFAEAIGNFWGVGQQETDNGILILASAKERAVHIATGEGTAKHIEDERIQAIIEGTTTAAFKSGEFHQGLQETVVKIFKEVEYSPIDIRSQKKAKAIPWLYIVLGLLLLGLLILAIWMLSRRKKKQKKDGNEFDGFGGGKFREGSGAGGEW